MSYRAKMGCIDWVFHPSHSHPVWCIIKSLGMFIVLKSGWRLLWSSSNLNSINKVLGINISIIGPFVTELKQHPSRLLLPTKLGPLRSLIPISTSSLTSSSPQQTIAIRTILETNNFHITSQFISICGQKLHVLIVSLSRETDGDYQPRVVTNGGCAVRSLSWNSRELLGWLGWSVKIFWQKKNNRIWVEKKIKNIIFISDTSYFDFSFFSFTFQSHSYVCYLWVQRVPLLKDSHSGYCCRTFSYTILGTHLARDHANSWAETGHLMRKPGGSQGIFGTTKSLAYWGFTKKLPRPSLKKIRWFQINNPQFWNVFYGWLP